MSATPVFSTVVPGNWKMLINLKREGHQQLFPFTIAANETVAGLKRAIQPLFKVPLHLFWIELDNLILNEEHTLTAQNVPAGATLLIRVMNPAAPVITEQTFMEALERISAANERCKTASNQFGNIGNNFNMLVNDFNGGVSKPLSDACSRLRGCVNAMIRDANIAMHFLDNLFEKSMSGSSEVETEEIAVGGQQTYNRQQSGNDGADSSKDALEIGQLRTELVNMTEDSERKQKELEEKMENMKADYESRIDQLAKSNEENVAKHMKDAEFFNKLLDRNKADNQKFTELKAELEHVKEQLEEQTDVAHRFGTMLDDSKDQNGELVKLLDEEKAKNQRLKTELDNCLHEIDREKGKLDEERRLARKNVADLKDVKFRMQEQSEKTSEAEAKTKMVEEQKEEMVRDYEDKLRGYQAEVERVQRQFVRLCYEMEKQQSDIKDVLRIVVPRFSPQELTDYQLIPYLTRFQMRHLVADTSYGYVSWDMAQLLDVLASKNRDLTLNEIKKRIEQYRERMKVKLEGLSFETAVKTMMCFLDDHIPFGRSCYHMEEGLPDATMYKCDHCIKIAEAIDEGDLRRYRVEVVDFEEKKKDAEKIRAEVRAVMNKK